MLYTVAYNNFQIWQQVKRQSHHQQQTEGSSNTSTLQSRDSGLSTMSSTNTQSPPNNKSSDPNSAGATNKTTFDQLRSQSLQESSLPPPAASRLRERAAAAYVNLLDGGFGKSSSVRPPLPSTSSSGVASLDSGYGATGGSYSSRGSL